MSTASQASTPAKKICDLCLKVPWYNLQPEDVAAYPHQPSRTALEASATTCPMCEFVLKAAVSNYTDSRGVRNGKGYWRHFESVNYVEQGGQTRKVMFQKEYGAFVPQRAGQYERSPGGRPVIAPTGSVDASGEHIDEKTPDDAEPLRQQSYGSSMKVWLYGNWWADKAPASQTDQTCLRLMGVGARFAPTSSLFDQINSVQDQPQFRGSTIGVCTADNSIFPQIPGRMRELNSASELAITRIKNWISQCGSSHSYCRAPANNTPLPTRVIDVLAGDRVVALREPKGQRAQYVTLSHAWGSSSRITATTLTLADLKNGIATSFLPRTFRDAIYITKKLGLKYLWIDCLCIVQDDPQDWEREASNMGHVYRNSYVTISASSSPDSTAGFLYARTIDPYVSPASFSMGYYNKARQTRGGSSYTINYSGNEATGQSGSLHFFEEWLPGSIYHSPQRMEIGSFGKRFDPLGKSNLSTRGWTLQERLLSPRILHYAGDQIYFECESCIQSEDGFVFPDIDFSLARLFQTQVIGWADHGVPRDAGISFIVGQYPSGRQGIRWQGGWLGLIQDYSQRRLTKPEDKLPALAGLASLVAYETNDQYFAGLWANHIYEDLCWRTYVQEERVESVEARGVPKKGRVLGYATRPATYRAPSWSWASLDAPIRFLPMGFRNIVAKMKDCRVTPSGADPYGRLSGGQLDIEAPLFEIFPHTPTQPFERHGIPVEIHLGDARKIGIGALHLDIAEDRPFDFPCYALFLDPAHAIVVRSNGRISEVVRAHSAPGAFDDYPNDGQMLNTKLLHEMAAEDPSVGGRLHKSVWDVQRIGLADFVKTVHSPGQGPEKQSDPNKLVKTLEGMTINVDDVLSIGGGDSWGPITTEDLKVWVTIF